MLARVAARGSRIRAVRGAVNALVIISVVGASALGAGAVIGGLGDKPGTEVDNIAMVPEPPDTGAPGRPDVPGGSSSPSDPSDPSDPSTTVGTTGSTSSPGTSDAGSPGTGGAGGGGNGAATTTGSTAPGSTAPGSSTSRPQSPTSGAEEPTTAPGSTTSTTEVPAPRVGAMRARVDGGVPTGEAVCVAPTAEIAVDIENADRAVVTWNRAGESRSVELTAAGETEWSAPIVEIDETAADIPLIVTVTAIGPGGTTRTSTALKVADCTPIPSVPSVPGS